MAHKQKKQSGVALITAVLIVAIAVVAAISVAENYQYNFYRTESAFNGGQAWAYAKGGEEWAMAILARDAENNTYDAYDIDNEWWNSGVPIRFPLPNGYIEGDIKDAHSKLNVNALIDAEGVFIPEMRQVFERLFQKLDINPGLVCALIDWIDTDINPTCSDGAEADIYIGLEPPYLPADQPMNDISELSLIHKFDAEIVDKLLPHLIALPVTANSVVNINTVSAVVFESLSNEYPSGLGEELIAQRNDEPFKSIGDLAGFLSFSGKSPPNIPVVFGSNYFILRTKCVIGISQVRMLSLIHRVGGNDLKVIKRSQEI